jgi:hypothetical protein
MWDPATLPERGNKPLVIPNGFRLFQGEWPQSESIYQIYGDAWPLILEASTVPNA